MFIEKETGFCFEKDLPIFLQKSLATMKQCWAVLDSGGENLKKDVYWDELNADINCAEADGQITHEQANALRQRYLLFQDLIKMP